MKVAPERIEETILALVEKLEPGKTISPADAARAIAGDKPDEWGRLMGTVRQVAVRLMKQGRIVIRRKGRPVDPDDFRGVYRIAGPGAEGDADGEGEAE